MRIISIAVAIKRDLTRPSWSVDIFKNTLQKNVIKVIQILRIELLHELKGTVCTSATNIYNIPTTKHLIMSGVSKTPNVEI